MTHHLKKRQLKVSLSIGYTQQESEVTENFVRALWLLDYDMSCVRGQLACQPIISQGLSFTDKLSAHPMIGGSHVDMLAR